MYAIIETSGKQYRVSSGDVLILDRLAGKVGEKLTLDKVLLIGGASAKAETHVGAPYVQNATLEAEIVEHTRGEKLTTIKYKRRKGYRRKIGHRQELTKILVTKISDGAGNNAECDNAKRVDALKKASVKFSTREKKVAKTATKNTEKAPTAAKKVATSETTTTGTAKKKAAPKKSTKTA